MAIDYHSEPTHLSSQCVVCTPSLAGRPSQCFAPDSCRWRCVCSACDWWHNGAMVRAEARARLSAPSGEGEPE